MHTTGSSVGEGQSGERVGVGSAIVLPARLAPSALTRYRTCPRQFLLADIDQLGREEKNSPVLAQGSAIHEALQLFFGLDLAYRSADNLERCLRSIWLKHTSGVFQTLDEEAYAGRAAVEMLRAFPERFDITVEPVARERWVGVRVGGTRLYGKVDRLDRHGDGLTIVDYKTGRRSLDTEDLKHEPAVQVYVHGVEATYGMPVEQVRFIYLALGTEICWNLERDDVTALGEALIGTLRAIRDDQEFAAVPGRQCDFCPVALHCPDKDRVEIEEVAAAASAAGTELVF